MSTVIRLLSPLLFFLPTMALQAQLSVQFSEDGFLGDSHGNNMVIGRHNTVHLVHTSKDGVLKYHRGYEKQLQSGSSFIFSFPTSQSSIFEYYESFGGNLQSPSVAEDWNGNLGIAYIDTYDLSSYGDLWYQYRNTASQTGWKWQCIARNVRRPAIAISKDIAHLVWEDPEGRIRYVQFQADQPPQHIGATAEVVMEDTCPFSSYTKPSITVFRDPCASEIVRVAAIFTSDEYSTTTLTCGYSGTMVGPVVRERHQASQTWNTLFNDVRTAASLNQKLQATSISISSCYDTGVTYLAYSDVLNQQGRTKIAVGYSDPSTWQSVDHLPNQASLIHVIAYRYGANGEFRIAWQELGANALSNYRSGSWFPGQTGPSWLESNAVTIGNNQALRQPQAIYWQLCGNQPANLHWGATMYIPSIPVQGIAHDFTLDLRCRPIGFSPFPPCSVYTSGEIYLWIREHRLSIDLEKFGRFKHIDDEHAIVSNGKHEYRLSWEPGRLESYWETGLRLRDTEPPQVEHHRDAPPVKMIVEGR